MVVAHRLTVGQFVQILLMDRPPSRASRLPHLVKELRGVAANRLPSTWAGTREARGDDSRTKHAADFARCAHATYWLPSRAAWAQQQGVLVPNRAPPTQQDAYRRRAMMRVATP